ncbi:uncharacterized protein LOC127242863 [Andrographis paniculata]|uniref:uncharacterized protein LOC127242863 n=1 Tax=Andrographis paniculata TaxID=175694 RepID=UPI0021E90E44|nr:uncharacterized protein LOC127242863 [Andrographis paniculata]
MEDGGQLSFQYGGRETRLDIVSGRGQIHSQNGDQMYAAAAATYYQPSPPLNRTKEIAPRWKSKAWGLGDAEAEVKRRKRIAKYKIYTVEGRVKDSIRKGVRWIKNKCSEIIRGY